MIAMYTMFAQVQAAKVDWPKVRAAYRQELPARVGRPGDACGAIVSWHRAPGDAHIARVLRGVSIRAGCMLMSALLMSTKCVPGNIPVTGKTLLQS